jgi:iron complex transport system substrate-binding protein
MVSPALPFGWIEEPPSINRLIGLAWLEGRDPLTLASLSNAIVYGHVLTPSERDGVLAVLQP